MALPPAAAAPAEDGQWTMPGKNYASTRYSELGEINTESVRDLQVTWTFSTGVLRGHEAPPLVVGTTMYVVTPYPNILYALDLTRPGAPAKWRYEPKPDPSSQGVACCDYVNRGRLTPTGGSSSTRSTTRPSRSTPGAAASCGGRSSATSTRARA